MNDKYVVRMFRVTLTKLKLDNQLIRRPHLYFNGIPAMAVTEMTINHEVDPDDDI